MLLYYVIESCFAPLNSAFYAVARLIAVFLASHIIISLVYQRKFHWLSLTVQIQFKSSLSYLESVPGTGSTIYLCNLIKQPIFASLVCPLRSFDHQDILVHRSRTTSAQPLPRPAILLILLLYSALSCRSYLGFYCFCSLFSF